MLISIYIEKLLHHWQLLFSVVAVTLISCYLMVRHYLIHRLSLIKSQKQSLKVFIRYWVEPLLLGFIVIVIHALLPTSIKEQANYIHALEITKIIIFTLLATTIVGTIKEVIINKNKQHLYNLSVRRINTQINVLAGVGTVMFTIVGIALIIMTFPQVKKVGISILTSAGIMGIALGFAAQRSLGNIWAGIQIALAQPIKIGDKVVVENEVGTIESIRLTYVVMRTIGNRKLIIPINYFNEKTFQNWTKNSLDLLAIVSFEVDDKVPVKKIDEEFEQILLQTKLWDKKTKEFQVIKIRYEFIEIRAIASTARASDAQELQYYISRRLVDFIQEYKKLN